MSQYVDAVELIVQMTKGEGEMPNVAMLKSSAIKKLFAFIVNHEVLKSIGFTHYRIVKAGEKSASLSISDGKIDGFPTLTVRIYRYPDFRGNSADVFGNDRALAGSAFSYKVSNEGDEFFFFDANGLTEVVRIAGEMKSPEIFDEKLRAKCVEL